MRLFQKISSDVNLFRRKGMLDIIVVFGLFVVSAVLVLGLFPRDSGDQGRSLYLYTMMTVPIIIAIYFILISFSRTVKRAVDADSSLRTKITLIFIFMTTVPLIPVVLISNTVITRTIESVASTDTDSVLKKAVDLSRNEIRLAADDMNAELVWIRYALDNNTASVDSYEGRKNLADGMTLKGFVFQCYKVKSLGDISNKIEHFSGDTSRAKYSESVKKYISLINLTEGNSISHISVESSSIIVGAFARKGALVVLYRPMPSEFFSQIHMFADSLDRYRSKINASAKLQGTAGFLLLIVSIAVIISAMMVSLYVAKTITLPTLQIAEAAKSVAAGNFDVSLSRDAKDEIALLYQSFNTMTKQLKENREAMYVAQKLNAWREVSKKILHEIKNPLTPIRLSAERIRRRFSENQPDMATVVMKGTDTIIEEVRAIQRILDEFTAFARLPEVKPEPNFLNTSIKLYVGSFHGHEKIIFDFALDETLPEVLFDKMLLRNAVSNIIKNAIEAMKGSGTIFVATGRVNDRTAFLSIRDTGPGISPEDIKRLFEPSFSRKEGGTGLGLAIVEKIALDHHGKIYCRSKEGEGATFVIELPFA